MGLQNIPGMSFFAIPTDSLFASLRDYANLAAQMLGGELRLNFSTSAAGSIRVEIQDEAGRPLPGHGLEECEVIYGDTLDRRVAWKQGADVSALQGRPVRLRFVLEDADLFSLWFAPA